MDQRRPSPALQAVLAEVRQLLARVLGPDLLRTILFGSHARGEAREDSDIDVMVVVRHPFSLQRRDEVYEGLSELCLRHGVVVSLTFMQEKAYRQGRMPLLNNVAREGIVL